MKTKIPIIVASILLLCASCTESTSYSNSLKEEEKLIANFIERQGITVVDTEPTTLEAWGEKVYWKVPDYDNFYFHLINQGDTTQDEIESGDIINLRYTQYTLEAYADTTRYWTTDDSAFPIEMKYGVSSDNACTGWHLAIKYMKYTGASCKIICPSKLGFDDANSDVIPYGYDMKIQVKHP